MSQVSDQQGVYFSGQLQSEAQLENNLIAQLVYLLRVLQGLEEVHWKNH
jgi:hypothetical protein